MNDTLSEAVAWIGNHDDEMLDFLAEFVRYRSTTEAEAEVQNDLLAPYFEEKGWHDVDIVDVSNDGNRPNVNARLQGAGNGRNLLFNGHCDVVDVPQEKREKFWTTDPWEAQIKDGVVYGRGTSDMKGPLTAMIWGVRSLIETDAEIDGDVLVSVVVGEERAQQDYGAIPATEAWLERVDVPFCVNCEPTNLEIHTTSAALFNIDIRVYGKAVHASQHNLVRYPQRRGVPQGREVGVDAIRPLTALLDRLFELEHQLNMSLSGETRDSPAPDDLQGVGTITIVPTVIEAGEYIASIADEARIEGQVYLPPSIDPQRVREKIEAVIDTLVATDGWLADHPPEVEFGGQLGDHREYSYWPAFEVPTDAPGSRALGRSVQKITGEEAVYSGFKAVTDGGFIQKVCGVDSISFGPGNTTMGVHGANEYVPIDQLTQAAKIYAAMILEWCRN